MEDPEEGTSDDDDMSGSGLGSDGEKPDSTPCWSDGEPTNNDEDVGRNDETSGDESMDKEPKFDQDEVGLAQKMEVKVTMMTVLMKEMKKVKLRREVRK